MSQPKNLDTFQSRRRLLIAVLVVVLFGILLFVPSMFPPETFAHEAIEMVGMVVIFAGIVGRLWSTLYIGGKKSAQIVTIGPYSVMRNPLYFFSAVAAAGAGAQSGSITVGILFFVICALVFHYVILREERFLSGKFGAPYNDYLKRVPRFFPNPSLYVEGSAEGFQSKRLLMTLVDGLMFIAAMPIFELIDAAQVSGALPVLMRLP